MGYVRNSQYKSNNLLSGTESNKNFSYGLIRVMATIAIIHRFKDLLTFSTYRGELQNETFIVHQVSTCAVHMSCDPYQQSRAMRLVLVSGI